jgi:hypothetical protein
MFCSISGLLLLELNPCGLNLISLSTYFWPLHDCPDLELIVRHHYVLVIIINKIDILQSSILHVG